MSARAVKASRLVAGFAAAEGADALAALAAVAAPDLAIDIPVAADESMVKAALRRLRRREMARIAARALEEVAELDETLQDLSALADFCCETALRWSQDRLVRLHGHPRDAQGEPAARVRLGDGALVVQPRVGAVEDDLTPARPDAGAGEVLQTAGEVGAPPAAPEAQVDGHALALPMAIRQGSSGLRMA